VIQKLRLTDPEISARIHLVSNWENYYEFIIQALCTKFGIASSDFLAQQPIFLRYIEEVVHQINFPSSFLIP
jgi:hypothetical protein